jgi:hypothetical protein
MQFLSQRQSHGGDEVKKGKNLNGREMLEALAARREILKKEREAILEKLSPSPQNLDKKAQKAWTNQRLRIRKIEEEFGAINAEMEFVENYVEIDEAIATVKKYLPIGKYAIDNASGEVLALLSLLLGTFNNLRQGLEKELDRSSDLGAKAKKRDYNNLIKAGFKEHQAFQIILAEIKPLGFADVISSLGALEKNIEIKK